MILLELQPRIVESKDWATIVFVLAFALIVFAKSAFENRFNDFVRLLISDKYLKIYRDSSHLMSGFTILLFIVNLISLTFFIQLVLNHYDYGEKVDWTLFVRIFTLLMVFIVSKFLFEKIIATIFGIEELIETFNLQKVNFRTYIGLLLLPVSVVIFYSNYSTNSLILTIGRFLKKIYSENV